MGTATQCFFCMDHQTDQGFTVIGNAMLTEHFGSKSVTFACCPRCFERLTAEEKARVIVELVRMEQIQAK